MLLLASPMCWMLQIAKLQADMEKLQGGAAEAAESHGSELSALQVLHI